MPRILYVTALWSGLADILFHGSPPRGMPAFIRPLKTLIERGYEVDLLILDREQRELNIGVDWLKKEQLALIKPQLGRFGMLGALVGLYGYVQKRLRTQQYDFVYGQGTVGTLGVLAARKANIPCGQRLYGISYFVQEFLGGKLSSLERIGVFIRHPLHYMAFSLAKAFLLVTNDGSRADIVYQQIGSSKQQFLFWLNGVDQQQPHQDTAMNSVAGANPFLLYPGRIDRFKRQHLAIELVHKLKAKSTQPIKLVFAGHDYDQEYRAELDKLVDDYAVSELVEFLGPVTRLQLQDMYFSCLAVLSFYDVSNLGNVAIEALASGAALISLADGTLDAVAVHGESAYLVNDMDEAAAAVCELQQEPKKRESIKQGARTAANERFVSWDERVAREIEQIDAAIAARTSSMRGA